MSSPLSNVMGSSGRCILEFHRTFRWLPSSAEHCRRRVEEFDIVLKKTADDKYLSQAREQQKDIPVCALDDLAQLMACSIRPQGNF
jgi:hypothetical protein